MLAGYSEGEAIAVDTMLDRGSFRYIGSFESFDGHSLRMKVDGGSAITIEIHRIQRVLLHVSHEAVRAS